MFESSAGGHWLVVRDRAACLRSMLTLLASDSTLLSLEGDLSRCAFPEQLVVSRNGIGKLQRICTNPILDVAILSVAPSSVDLIMNAALRAGFKSAIIHVQIDRAGVREFGAYDNFHPDCVFSGPGVAVAALNELRCDGVLRSFCSAD